MIAPFFVNVNTIDKSIQVKFISTWLDYLILSSTIEHQVNLCSLIYFAALHAGFGIDYIITMTIDLNKIMRSIGNSKFLDKFISMDKLYIFQISDEIYLERDNV